MYLSNFFLFGMKSDQAFSFLFKYNLNFEIHFIINFDGKMSIYCKFFLILTMSFPVVIA